MQQLDLFIQSATMFDRKLLNFYSAGDGLGPQADVIAIVPNDIELPRDMDDLKYQFEYFGKYRFFLSGIYLSIFWSEIKSRKKKGLYTTVEFLEEIKERARQEIRKHMKEQLPTSMKITKRNLDDVEKNYDFNNFKVIEYLPKRRMRNE
ncbi:hypothetical protein [Bacillus sp. REN10]|uniref:hypothetical protein n=1 Tax=Bacillus sp. REN10 TaxID=2782541 RepID=UPI00193C5A89|nr:hypothetical protein [Bacillus sp. REN10]